MKYGCPRPAPQNWGLWEWEKKKEWYIEHDYPEEKINSSADITIVMPAGPYELTFTGEEYLNLWVLPNMFFHISTTYNILRHNGVAIGKVDFLGVGSFITKGP